MTYVAINALSVPESQGPELEARFAARRHAVDSSPGFQSFQLLRPVAGDTRYLVVTHWETREDFEAWRAGRSSQAHDGSRQPVATGAELLEYEVVD